MPKGQRTETLTLEAIVDESERIARTRGVDGLTMRTVAAGLGVTPMAIYYYVPGKEDLLRLVVGRVSDSFGLLHREEDRSWQEALRDYLLNIWESFRRYPGLSSYLINQPALGVTPDRLEAGIGFFVEAGFPPDVGPTGVVVRDDLYPWPYQRRRAPRPECGHAPLRGSASPRLRHVRRGCRHRRTRVDARERGAQPSRGRRRLPCADAIKERVRSLRLAVTYLEGPQAERLRLAT